MPGFFNTTQSQGIGSWIHTWGSGSSRIAAWDAGLDFIGYEIDPEYFEAQEKRFKQHTAQLSMFGGGGYLITIYIFRKMKATCAWC